MANFNVDSSGNLWIGTGVSDSFSTAQSQANTKFYVTSAGSINAIAGTIGGNTLGSNYIQSSNYSSSSGSEAGWKITSTGDADFNNVNIRGDLFGVELKDTLTLNSGTFRTSSSGTRVEITDNSSLESEVRYYNSSNNTLMRLAGASDTEFLIENGLSSGEIRLVTNVLGTGIEMMGNEIDLRTPLGIVGPKIRINGSLGSSKKLGVNSSGQLEFQTDSAGSHNHTESEISDIGSHSHSYAAVSHGTHVSNTTAVQSLTASGTAGSVSGDVTIDSNAAGGGFISGNPTRSGNTINIGASINGYIGQAYPTGSTKKIGVSASDRFTSIYSSGFYGTFYGQNINASSRNIKENIEDTALGLDFLNDLEVKDFTMIDTDTFGTQKYTGFIAEDIQKYLDDNDLDYKLTEDYSGSYEFKDSCSHPIMPNFEDEDQTITYMHDTLEECEAYMPDENRHPHLYFNNFVGPLVKAVQELSTLISDLTARVEALEG